ncbi:hypothetical protein SM033_00116 [Vibrio phage vB_VpaM_sm033]|nr:hypothetical protein SM033_00116 [Vibrio phage vB_VpaM_sm033]
MSLLNDELFGEDLGYRYQEMSKEEAYEYSKIDMLPDIGEYLFPNDLMANLQRDFVELEALGRLERECTVFDNAMASNPSQEAMEVHFARIQGAFDHHEVDLAGKPKVGMGKALRNAATKIFRRIMKFLTDTFKRAKKAVTSRLPGARKIEELANEINEYNDGAEFKLHSNFQIFLVDAGREMVRESQIIKTIQDVEQVVRMLDTVETEDLKEVFMSLASGKELNNMFPSVVQTDNRMALKTYNMGLHKDSVHFYTATFDTVNLSGNTTRQLVNLKRPLGTEDVFARETVKELTRACTESMERLEKLDLDRLGKKIAKAQTKRFDAIPEGELTENTPIVRAVTSYLMSAVNYQMTLADHGMKLASVNLTQARKKVKAD